MEEGEDARSRGTTFLEVKTKGLTNVPDPGIYNRYP